MRTRKICDRINEIRAISFLCLCNSAHNGFSVVIFCPIFLRRSYFLVCESVSSFVFCSFSFHFLSLAFVDTHFPLSSQQRNAIHSCFLITSKSFLFEISSLLLSVFQLKLKLREKSKRTDSGTREISCGIYCHNLKK